MNKLPTLFMAMVSAVYAVAEPLDSDWEEFDGAYRDGQLGTATNVLARIEKKATAQKTWTDVAAAFLFRSRIEYGTTEENALDAERVQGLVGAYAAKVEGAPPEVRPMLRLALAHDFLSMNASHRYRRHSRTRLADKTNEPPWSADRIRGSVELLLNAIAADRDMLMAEDAKKWDRLLPEGDKFAESFRPTLWDFALNDAVDLWGNMLIYGAVDNHGEKQPVGESMGDRVKVWLNELAEFHGKAGRTDAQAYAILRGIELFGGDKKAFAEEWFDKSPASALAAHSVAESLSHGTGDERLEAHSIAVKYHDRWPNTPGGWSCRQVAANLELPALEISTESQLLPKGEKIVVSSRNISRLFFRVVKIAPELATDQEFAKLLRGEYPHGNMIVDDVLASKPAAEWSAQVNDEHNYADCRSECEIPAGIPNGFYVIFAATTEDFDAHRGPVKTALVSRTDLFLTVARDDAGHHGFVYDAETGIPQAGVDVEYWVRDGQWHKFNISTKTGDDGSWSLAYTGERREGMFRAVRDGSGTMFFNCNNWHVRKPSATTNYCHASIITDRSIYRPGQKILFKGYVFHADRDKRDFNALSGQRVEVILRDPNFKEVEKMELTSNDFGSFNGGFILPRNGLTGRYGIDVNAHTPIPTYTGASVSVEEYKRPKFTATIDKADGLELGKETTLTGRALTYSGLPVAKAKVKWKIERSTIYPQRCWWHAGNRFLHPVASGEAVTDANGEFKCAFTPEAESGAKLEDEPCFSFWMFACVTDESGEMHRAECTFSVGAVPWHAGISEVCLDTDTKWRKVDEGTRFRTWLKSSDGKPVANVSGEVKAFSLAAPDGVVRKPLQGQRIGFGIFLDLRHYRAHNPLTWSNAEVVASCKVTTDENGGTEGVLKLPAGAYRLEYAVKTPDGKAVHDERVVRVFDPYATRYAIREPFFHDLEKDTVRVGDTARLFFGTGYDTACWRVRVMQGGKMLLDEVRTGSAGVVEFPVKEEHRGFLSFELVFVRENRIYAEQHMVNVPWDGHRLKISGECMTSNKLRPDATATWRFRVSGENTNDVRRGVEALALMFDKSLDAFRQHCPGIDFSQYFSYPAKFAQWHVANSSSSFLNWRGVHYPYSSSPRIGWRRWRQEGIGLFDTLCGGRYGRMALMPVNGWPSETFSTETDEDEVFMEMLADELPDVDAQMTEAYAVADQIAAKNAMPDSEPQPVEEAVVPRKNLQETAFFMPSLVADENGVVEFSFTVPQAITGWKFFLLAHGKNLSTGCFCKDDIVTVKPLMAEPNGPRFVREGDDFLFPVKVTNTSDKPEKGHVALEFFDADSGRPALENGRFEFDLAAGESKTFEFRTRIPDGCGYLRYVAKAAGEKFADGEEGFLPVLSRCVMVQESMPLQIRKKGERKFHFERLEKSGESNTLRHVGLAAQVVSDPTWYAFLALPYLMEYPHECNEQVFSRYYANALAEKLANSDPAYKEAFMAWEKDDANALRSPLELNDDLKSVVLDATPWVNDAADESSARRRLGELFGSARLESEQARSLESLKNGVAGDGLWPWFPGGPGSELVTMHILTGFARLKSFGVDPMEFDKGMREKAEKARSALDAKMEEDMARRLAMPSPFTLQSHDLRWLYLQSFDGSWNRKHEELLFKHLAEEWTKLGIAGEAMAAIVAWRHGDKDLARKIVRGLKERAVRSEEFGLYWKRRPFFDCSLFAAPVSDHALAMEAFLLVAPDDVAAYDDARLWLLEQKRTQNWSSTVSTADAVYAILLGRGKGAPVKAGPVAMKLGETEVSREKTELGTGFYEGRFGAGEIKPGMGEITLSREEDALGWASVSWTYLEDAAKVAAYEEKDLRVTKTYYKKMRVNGKISLVGLGGGEKLMPGDELVSRITIDSNRVYEYVHLKDERPASAEPVDVISRYRWQDGLGYYQSTRDTATHFYFDRLPKGNFVLETSYRVRQKGVFSSGLATLECMYAPEFGAHSDASVIEVAQP